VDSCTTEMDSQPSGSSADAVDVNESGSSKLGGSEPEGAVLCLQDRLKWLDQPVIRKVVLFPKAYPFLIYCDYYLHPPFVYHSSFQVFCSKCCSLMIGYPINFFLFLFYHQGQPRVFC